MTQKVYLDANILIAHQIQNHPFYEKSLEVIDSFFQQKFVFVIASLTMDEFMYGTIQALKIIDKNKKFEYIIDELNKATRAVLSWENLELIDFQHTSLELLTVISLMKKYHLKPRDAFHLRIMQQQNINNFITFDHDFDILLKSGKINIIH
ncbi:type II toxin-antitoxin system VapC family toxin [Candidatus Gottesmanbacteria bacterium]|nr:type II toxin-antitoxin system VapC family toxin [Candidatus Gottesmanbacteria bacterium]